MAEKKRSNRWIRVFALLAVVAAGPGWLGRLHAEGVTSGYVYAGDTFGHRIDGAGRFGFGFDFSVAPHFDVGAEIGTIVKSDVGIMGSGNVSYHFDRPRRGEQWDPFLVMGLSAAHFAGSSGLYVNLGGGVNYWVSRRWALRGEFKAYPGGQDLGGFGEFRFGVAFH